MRTFYCVLAGLLALALHNSASAETFAPTWDLSGSTSASLGVDHEGDGGGESFALLLATRVSYFVTPVFELGASVGLNFDSSSNSSPSTFSSRLLVGPTFNFSDDVLNSFFVTAHAGVRIYYSSRTTNTYLPFAFFGGLGRRVELARNVTWTPELAIYGNLSSEQNGSILSTFVSYELRLIQLSVLF